MRFMPKYFAYGSNMSHEQMGDRCPSHEFICIAQLPDHRLAFTRYSRKRACGVADFVPAPGESVWGAVFELSDSELAALDLHEGVHAKPPAYVRCSVQVVAANGRALDAITYEVANKSPTPYAPSVEYLGLIAAGARKWGLPQVYQEVLAKVETQA
jgi:gamma-glutamylcyclotransferase (GGCT)/AIG2-like uncharacterized protein YtfP